MRERCARALTALAATSAAVIGSAVLMAAPVAAEESAAPGAGELDLVARPEAPHVNNWLPGTSRWWQVDARVRGVAQAEASLRLFGEGTLVSDPALGLQVRVSRCSRAWVGSFSAAPACAGTRAEVVGWGRLADVSSNPSATTATVWTRALPPMTRAWEHLLVELRRPALPAGVLDHPQRSARFAVGVYVSGEEPEVLPASEENAGNGDPNGSGDGKGDLPGTGGPAARWVLLGLVLTGVGVGVRRLAGRDSRSVA